MAKVLVEDDCVDIRVSLLERVMLAEKPRKLPLSRIRAVDPHPPLIDMMVHWADQSGVWLCGVSAYDGHLIPSTRNPSHTLAIEIDGDEERIYIEIDDEAPERVAERIERAMPRASSPSPQPLDKPQLTLAQLVPREDDGEDWDETDDVQLRDPLLQGSLPPPPLRMSEPATSMKLEDDHDLARLGGWLVALGSLGVLTGTTIVAAGAVPGLLAVGAGIACGVLGGLALAMVAHHQG